MDGDWEFGTGTCESRSQPSLAQAPIVSPREIPYESEGRGEIHGPTFPHPNPSLGLGLGNLSPKLFLAQAPTRAARVFDMCSCPHFFPPPPFFHNHLTCSPSLIASHAHTLPSPKGIDNTSNGSQPAQCPLPAFRPLQACTPALPRLLQYSGGVTSGLVTHFGGHPAGLSEDRHARWRCRRSFRALVRHRMRL
jgi:hypothetical protein